MVRVRLRGSEVVHYDQIVQMSLSDFERLEEAIKLGEEEEIGWITDNYLDREERNSSNNFELESHVECDVNGNPTNPDEQEQQEQEKGHV